MRNHVLKNAFLPVVTMLGMDVGIAFGGAVFIETVFGLPGIGRLALPGLGASDLPVIMGIIVLVTVAIAIFNLVADLALRLARPAHPACAARQRRAARACPPAGAAARAQPQRTPESAT